MKVHGREDLSNFRDKKGVGLVGRVHAAFDEESVGAQLFKSNVFEVSEIEVTGNSE